jgi:hypothetical protein
MNDEVNSVSDEFRNTIIAMTTGMQVNADGSYAPINEKVKEAKPQAQGKDISQMTQAEILESVMKTGRELEEQEEKEDADMLNEVMKPENIAMVMRLSEIMR